MASTKTETMLVWVELPPRCKLSAHLEHVGGFAAHLHHDSGMAHIYTMLLKLLVVSGLIITTFAPSIINCKRLPSHTGQEQACTRITRLIVRSFVTMPKMAQYRKMVVNRPLAITSIGETLFETRKEE